MWESEIELELNYLSSGKIIKEKITLIKQLSIYLTICLSIARSIYILLKWSICICMFIVINVLVFFTLSLAEELNKHNPDMALLSCHSPLTFKPEHGVNGRAYRSWIWKGPLSFSPVNQSRK